MDRAVALGWFSITHPLWVASCEWVRTGSQTDRFVRYLRGCAERFAGKAGCKRDAPGRRSGMQRDASMTQAAAGLTEAASPAASCLDDP